MPLFNTDDELRVTQEGKNVRATSVVRQGKSRAFLGYHSKSFEMMAVILRR